MTTRPQTRPRSAKRTALTAALLAFCLAATACASSDTEPGAASEVEGDDSSGAALVDDGILGSDVPLSSDGPQYGDSLDEWHAADETSAKRPAPEAQPGFKTVEWEDLIPPGFSSEQVLARYEDRIKAAEPGSAELDDLYEEMNAEFEDGSVNPQLNSIDIQLAGFVAPLTYDGDAITEFLLVPYFGACIHVPPPPANQTVLVTLEEGESLTLEESWGAVWVAGEMIVTSTTTDLATAGYSISGAQFGVYEGQ